MLENGVLEDGYDDEQDDADERQNADSEELPGIVARARGRVGSRPVSRLGLATGSTTGGCATRLRGGLCWRGLVRG